jgi:sugar phosphate isomerase/epimerase
MKIGMVSLGMGAFPLTEVLQVAQQTGCEALELNGRATVHRNLWAAPVDYAALIAQIVASGVLPTSLGGYSNLAQPTDEGLATQVEQFVGYCAVAREMGIPIVRAFAGDVLEGYTLDQLYPRLVAGFKAIMARVGGWGLRVGIENHGRLINHGEQLLGLLHDVGSPALGITLDTGNFCWAGHSVAMAERFFTLLAPRVVNVHVKDGRFEGGAWVLTPAGRGALDLPGVFKTLAAAGYDGPVLSEYEGKGDFATATLEGVAYLRGIRDDRR